MTLKRFNPYEKILGMLKSIGGKKNKPRIIKVKPKRQEFSDVITKIDIPNDLSKIPIQRLRNINDELTTILGDKNLSQRQRNITKRDLNMIRREGSRRISLKKTIEVKDRLAKLEKEQTSILQKINLMKTPKLRNEQINKLKIVNRKIHSIKLKRGF